MYVIIIMYVYMKLLDARIEEDVEGTTHLAGVVFYAVGCLIVFHSLFVHLMADVEFGSVTQSVD